MNCSRKYLLKGFRNFLPVASILMALTSTSCQQNMERLEHEIVIPVAVTELKPGQIEKYIGITGTVKPVKEFELKTQLEGNYRLLKNSATQMPFALGDYIKEKQEIILIENREYENAIKLPSLKLSMESSGQNYEKQKSLYEKGGVTLTELKQAEISFMNARYSYEDALIKLGKKSLKAPFSGVIVDLPYYTPDVTIGANTPVAKLMDYSRLIMEVHFSESSLMELKKGQQVRVTNYVSPEDTITGVLSQISPAIDPETRSFKGTILLDNPKLILRPGMFVKAQVVSNRSDSTIIVPRNVLQSRKNTNVVFVMENGYALERVVTTGIESNEQVQILSGLKFNERLIHKGFETLKDQAKVKIVN